MVPWPTAATYNQVCDACVIYTVQHYGGQSVVVVDGYGRSASTKAAEQQQRRATQSISADILFECDMKTTTTQKTFHANSVAPRNISPSPQRVQWHVPACGNTLCKGHEGKEGQQWIGNNVCLTDWGWQYRD